MKKQWYKSLRYLLVIFALEGVNSYFMVESWIPLVENILRVWIVASQFYVIYLVVKVIKIVNPILKEKFSKYQAMSYISLVGLLFTASFLVVNFIYFVVFLFSPTLKRVEIFENRTFYIYDSSFVDYMVDVCTASDYLVTRQNLITVDNDYNLSLYQQGNKIILRTTTRGDIDIYDLQTSKKLYGGE